MSSKRNLMEVTIFSCAYGMKHVYMIEYIFYTYAINMFYGIQKCALEKQYKISLYHSPPHDCQIRFL